MQSHRVYGALLAMKVQPQVRFAILFDLRDTQQWVISPSCMLVDAHSKEMERDIQFLFRDDNSKLILELAFRSHETEAS